MNKNLKFICKNTHLIVKNNTSKFTNKFNKNETLQMPIAHKVGNYFISEDGLKNLISNNQIILRYSNQKGICSEIENPNGSTYNIAGITNKAGNVMGMMPHPERFYNNKNKDFAMKKILESLLNDS